MGRGAILTPQEAAIAVLDEFKEFVRKAIAEKRMGEWSWQRHDDGTETLHFTVHPKPLVVTTDSEAKVTGVLRIPKELAKEANVVSYGWHESPHVAEYVKRRLEDCPEPIIIKEQTK
jgi:hypothetical protein